MHLTQQNLQTIHELDTNSINQLNQTLDLIEASLSRIFSSEDNRDMWSLELAQAFVDLLSKICANAGNALADDGKLSSEYKALLKSTSINECLELFANQCKPIQSMLQLIQRCYSSSNKQTKMLIMDMLISASNKHQAQFDWALCSLGTMSPNLLFKKVLLAGLKEAKLNSPNKQLTLQQQQQLKKKLARINFINFYALNYAEVVKSELETVMRDSLEQDERSSKSTLVYVLRLMAQSPALLNLVLNELLAQITNKTGKTYIEYLRSYVRERDQLVISHLCAALRQMNNGLATFELLFTFLEWLSERDAAEEETKFENEYTASVKLIIVSAYLILVSFLTS
jgi:uncharacterized protein YejL (UPF0352 family)